MGWEKLKPIRVDDRDYQSLNIEKPAKKDVFVEMLHAAPSHAVAVFGIWALSGASADSLKAGDKSLSYLCVCLIAVISVFALWVWRSRDASRSEQIQEASNEP